MPKRRIITEISDAEERAINAVVAEDPDTFVASDEEWYRANPLRSSAPEERKPRQGVFVKRKASGQLTELSRGKHGGLRNRKLRASSKKSA